MNSLGENGDKSSTCIVLGDCRCGDGDLLTGEGDLLGDAPGQTCGGEGYSLIGDSEVIGDTSP